MKPAMIAELHKLNPDKEGDKDRLEYLLEQLPNRPCPTFGEKFGDKEYYYQHKDEVFDYDNSISSGSKVTSTSDIKGKLVDPHLQADGHLQAHLRSEEMTEQLQQMERALHQKTQVEEQLRDAPRQYQARLEQDNEVIRQYEVRSQEEWMALFNIADQFSEYEEAQMMEQKQKQEMSEEQKKGGG